MGGVWLNVGCGPHRAPEPWVNLDVHDGDGVSPDVVVDDAMFPLAGFEPDSVDRVYLGHVLEHVPWPDVGVFLGDIYRAVRPGGRVCAVGPDVLRVIQRWHEGLDPEGFMLVESVLENPWDRDYGYSERAYALIKEEPRWPFARHWWNCTEERMVWAFEQYTEFVDVRPEPIREERLHRWPLVAYTQWQCAVTARKP